MQEDVQNVVLSAEEIEFEQTVARYDEVLSKFKLLRARLLMNLAGVTDSSQGSQSPSEVSDVTKSLDEIEEKFHNLSIQEEMLKEIKISSLAYEIMKGGGPYEGLDILLKEHCANQARLFELSKCIRNEIMARKTNIERTSEKLSQLVASLKDDKEKFDEICIANSETNTKLKTNMEKQIKDIRFMQICISQMIVTKQPDLQRSERLRAILKSVRSPITSIEHFISDL